MKNILICFTFILFCSCSNNDPTPWDMLYGNWRLVACTCENGDKIDIEEYAKDDALIFDDSRLDASQGVKLSPLDTMPQKFYYAEWRYVDGRLNLYYPYIDYKPYDGNYDAFAPLPYRDYLYTFLSGTVTTLNDNQLVVIDDSNYIKERYNCGRVSFRYSK